MVGGRLLEELVGGEPAAFSDDIVSVWCYDTVTTEPIFAVQKPLELRALCRCSWTKANSLENFK